MIFILTINLLIDFKFTKIGTHYVNCNQYIKKKLFITSLKRKKCLKYMKLFKSRNNSYFSQISFLNNNKQTKL